MILFKNTKNETVITTVNKIDTLMCNDETGKYFVSVNGIFYEIEKEEFYKLKLSLKTYSELKEDILYNFNDFIKRSKYE